MDFRIQGRSGLKVHSQRPRSPLVVLGLVVVCYPTFMLGIWHGRDWLKERFDSAMSMVG